VHTLGSRVSKRDGVRCECDVAAKLRGRGGIFITRAVNASRSGILLEIQEPKVAKGTAAQARIQHFFRTGADISFPELSLKVRADLARVAAGEGESALRVAFRFRERLDEDRCRLLGIHWCDDGEPSF